MPIVRYFKTSKGVFINAEIFEEVAVDYTRNVVDVLNFWICNFGKAKLRPFNVYNYFNHQTSPDYYIGFRYILPLLIDLT